MRGGLGDAVSERLPPKACRCVASPCARSRAAASPRSCSIATASPRAHRRGGPPRVMTSVGESLIRRVRRYAVALIAALLVAQGRRTAAPACAIQPGRPTASASPSPASIASGRCAGRPRGRPVEAASPKPGTPSANPPGRPTAKRIAFAADRGRRRFDIYVSRARRRAGRTPDRCSGDERWPSWTRDGRIVLLYFARRPLGSLCRRSRQPNRMPSRRRSRLFTHPDSNEVQRARVARRTRVAFASNRGNDEGDFDIWVMRCSTTAMSTAAEPMRFDSRGRRLRTSRPGRPTAHALAYYAVRDGLGSTWVVGDRRARRDGRRRSCSTRAGSPCWPRVTAALPAWSPDGQTLAIGEIPEPEPSYNGNPQRDASDAAAALCLGRAYQLWTRAAPRPRGRGWTTGRSRRPRRRTAALTRAFDSVVEHAEADLLRREGRSSPQWEAPCAPSTVRARSRPARDGALEDVVDQMVAQQPLVKPAVTSSRAVVVSGASARVRSRRARPRTRRQRRRCRDCGVVRAGCRRARCVGHRRRRQAVLFLKGMPEPTVIEYKDQTPSRATLDNADDLPRRAARRPTGRLPANIPGVVAGLDHLYAKYGSGRVAGPISSRRRSGTRRRASCSTRRCRRASPKGGTFLEKYPEAARIFLPGRPRAAAGRSVRQSRLRRDAAGDRDRGRAGVLSRLDRAAHRRRHGRSNGGIITVRRSRAVPGDRAEAAVGPLSRPRPVHRRRRRCPPAFR